MKKDKKILIYIPLDKEQDEIIKKLAEIFELPKARIIRGIMTTFFENNKDLLKDIKRNKEEILKKLF